jgi:hypothetical protein
VGDLPDGKYLGDKEDDQRGRTGDNIRLDSGTQYLICGRLG